MGRETGDGAGHGAGGGDGAGGLKNHNLYKRLANRRLQDDIDVGARGGAFL